MTPRTKKLYALFFLVVFAMFGYWVFFNKPVSAHQPFFIPTNSPTESTPSLTINLSDGTVSHAFYGTFNRKGQSTKITLTVDVGEKLLFEVLIPDKRPENLIQKEDLPILIVRTKNGEEKKIFPDLRIKFYEPFSKMNLLRVASFESTATSEEYTLELVSMKHQDLRFVQSVGYKEIFFRRFVDGDFIETSGTDLNLWYHNNGNIVEKKSLVTNSFILLNNKPWIVIPVVFFSGLLLVLIYIFIKKVLRNP